MEQFVTPGAQYRGIPFWSWNCRVTRELIDKQLDDFAAMGFGGVDIHPRVGLDTEYLGDEYMEMVRYTVEGCKRRGLVCWLYDDDRFPSGAADGLVTRDVRYRDRGLFLTLAPQEDFCRSHAEFEQLVSAGQKPKGYFLCAYALDLRDGLLHSYTRLNTPDEITAHAGQTIRYAYVKLAREISSFHGQTYVDTMNPDATAEFLRITHDRYARTVGADFGATVQAIFTDEPRIGKQYQIAAWDSKENFEIPYSEYFDAFFRARTGRDVLNIVPELVWDMPQDRHMRARWIWRDALAECFTQSFMDTICGWCRAHGILMTGHVLSETPLIHQSATVGECMRTYRKMDIPGVDILCDDRSYVTVKQAVSVSKQMGRVDTMSELYGVTDWDCTFKTYKLQGDWQAALGVTKRVPHLSFMSMAGEGKRDWPASIFYQSPWYREFPFIEDHFARLNVALTQGKPVTRVAMVHPIESIWLHLGPADRNLDAVEKLQEHFKELTERLLCGLIDVDYLSESMLPDQARIRGNRLHVGEMAYEAVIVPAQETIRQTTLNILELFRQQGGQVIFLAPPRLVDALPTEKARLLAKACSVVPEEELLSALEPQRDLAITDGNGVAADGLFYQLREDAEGRWLFICHAKAEARGEERYQIRLRGSWKACQYDTQTGQIHPVSVTYAEDDTLIAWHCWSEDSLLLRLEAGQQKSVYPEPRYTAVNMIEAPAQVSLTEPNMLLLDRVQYSLDGSAYSSWMDVLKADNIIRDKLGFARRGGHMLQPYTLDAREGHDLHLVCEIESETEVPAQLALELPPECRVTLNGEAADMRIIGHYVDDSIAVIALPALRKGLNRLDVGMHFNQKTNLEAMYLLGQFDVALDGNRAVVRPQTLQPAFGDITGQGLPFYTGSIDYRIMLDVPADGQYVLRVPAFKAPLLAAWVDGRKAGVIAYAPHRVVLGELSAGRHEVTLRLYGSRYNGFGTLHLADRTTRWIGPDAFRSEWNRWTDNYLVRPVGIFGEVVLERALQRP